MYNIETYSFPLKQLVYESAPELKDLTGLIRHAAGRVRSDFDFDAAGGRARQVKERIAPNDSREIETTLYLGAYERENHTTRANQLASPVLVKTVHRHSLGGGMIYTRTFGGSDPGTKLTNVLKDHLGSTDALLVGTWNGSTFANQSIERLSFDVWGERRDASTQISYRATDTDPFRTSAKDHDRGYTGHEQLDDSGLIHMNGRIYDPELGRFLSPDPIVQIPEYSQNFNRYSYVLNNPLNATDPSGFSFISKAFSKIGSFIKENWRTIVVVVVGIVVGALSGGLAINFLVPALGIQSGTLAAAVVAGAVAGSAAGMASTAVMGGSIGDILRAGLIGGITGAITSGIQFMGLEWAYNNVHGADIKNLDVYEISDAEKAMLESEAKRKTYVLGASRKINNWQELKGYTGKIWVNGQSNDYFKAIQLGQQYTGSSKFLMLHNQSGGGLMDTVESSLDKISGATPVSRQVADVLSRVSPNSTLYGHSQGTILIRNALNMAARKRIDISSFTVHFDGAAVNQLGTNINFKAHGAKSLASFRTHPADAVPNIIGYNAFTRPNPYRIVGSVIAAPLLGVGGEWSPHTYRDGGKYIQWMPDLY